MIRPPIGTIPVERLAIFIDGWNFKYATYDSFNIQVDYTKLLSYLSQKSVLLRAYFYTGEWDDAAIDHYIRLTDPPDPEAKKAEMEEQRGRDRGFWRFLDRKGYKVVRKPVRVRRTATGKVDIKADLDLELAIDMLNLAEKCEKQILVSGDGDFVPLINAVAARAVRIVVVSTQHESAFKNSNFRASDDLLDAADEFLPIENIIKFIERK